MTEFFYSAKNRDGTLETGMLTADGKQDVIRELRARGQTPVSIEGNVFSLKRLLAIELTPTTLSLEGRATLFWQLSTYIEAGMGLGQALSQLKGGQRKKEIVQALEKAAGAIQEGRSVEAALSQPALALAATDLALISIGTKSGMLPVVLRSLADSYKERAARKSALTSALVYPCMLLATSVGVIALMLTVVVPEFEPIFASSGQELPALTRLVRDISAGMVTVLPYVIAALLLVWLGIAGHMRQQEGRENLHRLFLRLPVIGPYARRATLARTMGTLSLMLSGGVHLQQALSLVAGAEPNAYVSRQLKSAEQAVVAGSSLYDALLDVQLGSASDLALVSLGEKTGQLPTTLSRLSEILTHGQQASLARLAALATPLMTLVMGGVIGTIVWAVMSAILDVNKLV